MKLSISKIKRILDGEDFQYEGVNYMYGWYNNNYYKFTKDEITPMLDKFISFDFLNNFTEIDIAEISFTTLKKPTTEEHREITDNKVEMIVNGKPKR